ncbi:GNAT family N-acetyltransferase [Nannocystis exedens]|nr:GNAT family N-acetyltransferase [Nannocystis exedens]
MPRPTMIDQRSSRLQAAYWEYISEVFPGIDFRRWCEWGEWDDDYRAFAVVEDGRVLANASVSRMRLRVQGRDIVGCQLGAVGCLPEHRGRGLARAAMTAALAHCGDAPVLLFANETVRHFYPRFGFVPRPQHVFGAEHGAAPAPDPAPVVDLADPAQRASFRALAALATPISDRFGARGYGSIATWYAANGFASPLRALNEDAWVFAKIEGDVLHIDDIVARAPFDLREQLPRLIDRPIRALRFGFTPDLWWPQAEPVEVEADAYLFVRGLATRSLPDRFPVLART